MIQIIHNPRCSKSRIGLTYLQENNLEHEVIKYLDNPLSISEISEIVQKLNIKPLELIRKNEPVWKEKFKNKELTDAEVIIAMAEYPKLIERPIFIKGSNAVIGRPIENIDRL